MVPTSDQSKRVRQVRLLGTLATIAVLSVVVLYTLLDREVDGPNGDENPISDASIVLSVAPDLKDIHLASMQDVGQTEREMISSTPGIGFRFEDDFDSDGQQDLMLLGQHQGDGRRNSFVLVATRKSGAWRRSALLTFPEEFIIGIKYDKTVGVVFCPLCDHGGQITSSRGEYTFQPSEPAGVPE